LISGKLDRRRRALCWSTVASAALHVIILTLLFYAIAHVFIPKGIKEVVAQTTVITIQKIAAKAPRAAPAPHRQPRRIRQHESPPAQVPRPEIARITTRPAPPQVPHRAPSVPSRIERDEAGFAHEVAQLNEQNDPHAIPTIDPASRESYTKSYAFDVPSSMRGDEHGNGIITPVTSWHENGLDCYYGRYEYTYPDGANESANILWPFCFDPGADPFKLPPHPIPFPLPLLGFKLPRDAQMPPIEKSVYQQWATETGATSAP
jgi:hypothetical protein